jgi:CBS-domain-containing membrane protein
VIGSTSRLRVRDVMSTDVATCRATDSDQHAAQLMWDRDCGVVPVVDDREHAIGVVTDRDLCMASLTKGRSLAGLAVGEAMSGQVHACEADDALEDALGLMRRHRVRRLPVLDADRRVVGMLSLNDLVLAVEDGGRRDRKSLLDGLLLTLGAVSAHRAEPVVTLAPEASRSRAAPAPPARQPTS